MNTNRNYLPTTTDGTLGYLYKIIQYNKNYKDKRLKLEKKAISFEEDANTYFSSQTNENRANDGILLPLSLMPRYTELIYESVKSHLDSNAYDFPAINSFKDKLREFIPKIQEIIAYKKKKSDFNTTSGVPRILYVLLADAEYQLRIAIGKSDLKWPELRRPLRIEIETSYPDLEEEATVKTLNELVILLDEERDKPAANALRKANALRNATANAHKKREKELQNIIEQNEKAIAQAKSNANAQEKAKKAESEESEKNKKIKADSDFDEIKKMVESNTKYFGLKRLPPDKLEQLEELEAIETELLMDQVEKDRNNFLGQLDHAYGTVLVAYKRKNSNKLLDINPMPKLYSQLMESTMRYHLSKKFLDRNARVDFMAKLAYFIPEIVKRSKTLDTQTKREYEVLLSNALFQSYELNCLINVCNDKDTPLLLSPLINEIVVGETSEISTLPVPSYTDREIEELKIHKKKKVKEQIQKIQREVAEKRQKEAEKEAEKRRKQAINNMELRINKPQPNTGLFGKLRQIGKKVMSATRKPQPPQNPILNRQAVIVGGSYKPRRKTKKLRKTRRKQIKHTKY